MNCLSPEQIRDFIKGIKTPEDEAHMADCAECRTRMLAMLADADREFEISPELKDRTLDAIETRINGMEDKKTTARRFKFPRIAAQMLKMAFAAGVVAAVAITGFYMARGPLFHTAGNNRGLGNSPVFSGNNRDTIAREMSGSPETASVESGGHNRKSTVLVFDSITVHVGKIPVKKDRDALIRFGGKTGIAAGPAAVIDIKSRTDSTAYVELSKGTALFSIEKGKYREFIVQTPTARIVVTGTVFNVVAESAYTMVNVMEGSVRMQHQKNPLLVAVLRQGDGAFANSDSIINVLIQNSGMFNVREKILRDYIEGTIMHRGTDMLHESKPDVAGKQETEQGRETSAGTLETGKEK
jgi:hypothetical protein